MCGQWGHEGAESHNAMGVAENTAKGCSVCIPSGLCHEFTHHPRLAQQVEEVGGGFDPSAYASEIIWANSRGIDGHDPDIVPVSLSYRRDTMAGDGSNKCILHG